MATKRRTLREFAGLTDPESRAGRLLRKVAHELERLGVRWRHDEEGAELADLAPWVSFPRDENFAAVTLNAPHGIRGCLLVHRAVLES